MPTVGRAGSSRASASSIETSPVPGDVDAEVGDLARRLEAVAVEQERVGQEAQQLLDVVDVAVAQVLAGLRDGTCRGGRQRRHLGVGLGLAAQREQDRALRAAALDEQIQPLGPAAAAAEDATQDDAGAVEHLGDQRGGVRVATGVGAAHLGEARPAAARRRRPSRGSRCRPWSRSAARPHLRLDGGQGRVHDRLRVSSRAPAASRTAATPTAMPNRIARSTSSARGGRPSPRLGRSSMRPS